MTEVEHYLFEVVFMSSAVRKLLKKMQENADIIDTMCDCPQSGTVSVLKKLNDQMLIKIISICKKSLNDYNYHLSPKLKQSIEKKVQTLVQ